MSGEMKRLGVELAACDRDRGGRRRISLELRRRIVDAVSEERRRGASWPTLSRALDVGATQLQRWIATTPTRSFLEVDVDDGGAAAVPASSSSSLTLVTPSGFEVRGLTLSQVEGLLATASGWASS